MNDGTNDDEPSGDKGADVGRKETVEDQSTKLTTKPPSSSPRVAAKGPVPEVPRWRFVNKDQFAACNCP